MKPIAIDAIQMTQESLPTVAATAPMEKSTRGGTPLATQKAPVQSIPRSRPRAPVSSAATSAVILILFAPCRVNLVAAPLINALRAGFNGVEATPSINGQDKTLRTIFVVHRRFQ